MSPLTPARFLTTWSTDPVTWAVMAVPLAAYLAGLVVVRRRGRHWPWRRTAAFAAGWRAWW